jgi:intracellular septation protein
MKLLIDLFPVVLFFVAFKIKGIFFATVVAIIASIVQIGWMFFKNKKVEPMMWLSFGIIIIFGGATLLLHNETFIKWKPTILYWIFAVALIAGQLFFGKNAIKALLEKQMTLPEKIWKQMNLSWGGFFLTLGCVNLFVAYNYSTDIWVNFKLFGIFGLILVFSIVQGLIINGIKQDNRTEEKID